MSRKSLVPIELPGDPTQPLEAATKQYVDAQGGGGGGADEVWIGTTEPTDPNIELWYDSDEFVPEPPLTLAQADGRYVNTVGDTMSGPLVTIAPSAANHAANRAYVDSILTASWTAIPMSAPWLNYGSPYQVAEYCIIGGEVICRGLIKPSSAISASSVIWSGVPNVPAFHNLTVTLSYPGPTGYHAPARVDVLTTGVLQYQWVAGQASPSWVSLNGVRWFA
jgi:hypothetical protein